MKLVVLEGATARPSFEVLGERTLVGRAPECDVLVYDAQVSRHHAQILKLGQGFVIESLQPSNPFIVNDQVVSTRRQLADGDLIVMGNVMLEVDLPPADQITARETVQGAQEAPAPQPAPAPSTATIPVQRPSERLTTHPVAASAPAPAPSTPTAQPASVEQPATVVPLARPAAPPAVPTVAPAAAPTVEQPRPPRPRALPALAPREQIKAMATRLGEAGQRLKSRGDATPQSATQVDGDRKVVEGIVADHERLGGDQELARLASLLSERLSNQTDIRALYRLGAEAAVLIAWSRIAQRSMEEAMHLAQALGVH